MTRVMRTAPAGGSDDLPGTRVIDRRGAVQCGGLCERFGNPEGVDWQREECPLGLAGHCGRRSTTRRPASPPTARSSAAEASRVFAKREPREAVATENRKACRRPGAHRWPSRTRCAGGRGARGQRARPAGDRWARPRAAGAIVQVHNAPPSRPGPPHAPPGRSAAKSPDGAEHDARLT